MFELEAGRHSARSGKNRTLRVLQKRSCGGENSRLRERNRSLCRLRVRKPHRSELRTVRAAGNAVGLCVCKLRVARFVFRPVFRFRHRRKGVFRLCVACFGCVGRKSDPTRRGRVLQLRRARKHCSARQSQRNRRQNLLQMRVACFGDNGQRRKNRRICLLLLQFA